jgi:hypothetical protein
MIDTLIKNYKPITAKYKDSKHIIVYAAVYDKKLYINTNGLCDKNIASERWKRHKNIKVYINKNPELVYSLKNKGTWIRKSLLKNFGTGTALCTKNTMIPNNT